MISEKFNISERTVERQYSAVIKNIGKMVAEDRESLRSELMLRNDLIFKRSMEEGKFKTALDANMAQAKLARLFDEEVEDKQRPKIITLTQKKFDTLKVAEGDE